MSFLIYFQSFWPFLYVNKHIPAGAQSQTLLTSFLLWTVTIFLLYDSAMTTFFPQRSWIDTPTEMLHRKTKSPSINRNRKKKVTAVLNQTWFCFSITSCTSTNSRKTNRYLPAAPTYCRRSQSVAKLSQLLTEDTFTDSSWLLQKYTSAVRAR